MRKIFHNKDQLEFNSLEYVIAFQKFIKQYIESHTLYTDSYITKYVDSSDEIIDVDNFTSYDDITFYEEHRIAIYTYDTDITYGLDDIFDMFN